MMVGEVNYGGAMVTLSFYLYGDQAAGTVARETPLWQAWIQDRFPMPSEPSTSSAPVPMRVMMRMLATT